MSSFTLHQKRKEKIAHFDSPRYDVQSSLFPLALLFVTGAIQEFLFKACVFDSRLDPSGHGYSAKL